MTISHENPPRGSSSGAMSTLCLDDKFEMLKDIGDGSFGSVALARVRTAGSHVARRGSLIAVKTMKKTFESFAPCLELREVIFLRSLPAHTHLVSALDIFLDPLSKKLHICMEYMDGNLYQLMKARDHKCLDGASVKSILFQILSGLEHIHNHHFFHRDIKPENILVSTSAPQETSTAFRRYSALVTPPSTPPAYSIKIADFGLARETYSSHPYTTYVSTRWYRAPEVLLRAGEYSAPVDIWALGAMAVELANLKPLFPGGNEVDQVWRVCEIMGSPGNWYDKSGNLVGGGDWKEGTRLASKLGFSFPKMAPHSMDTILRPPQWPIALSSFVTWCMMWDPENRPTSAQAMCHEYFADAVDPLRPKSSSTSRILGKKQPSSDSKSKRESSDSQHLSSKSSSWFRRSLIARDSSSSAVPQVTEQTQTLSPAPSPVNIKPPQEQALADVPSSHKHRIFSNKRATWTNGTAPQVGAPMPILPSIRPISPFSAAVTAQAHNAQNNERNGNASMVEGKGSKKIGRQLSVASHGNHYGDVHRQEAERALNGQRDIVSPTQKEGFFSHLRKRARRLSGRHQAPISPTPDDIEANAGCAPWQNNRSSMIVDQTNTMDSILNKSLNETDPNLSLARQGEISTNHRNSYAAQKQAQAYAPTGSGLSSGRSQALSPSQVSHSAEGPAIPSGNIAPISSRTRRALQRSTNPVSMYDTPDEEDELLHEALNAAQRVSQRMDRYDRRDSDKTRQILDAKDMSHHSQPTINTMVATNPYPTPSPSAKRNGILFNQNSTDSAIPLNLHKQRPNEPLSPRWPTPPPEENEWAASAAASIFAAGSIWQ